MDCSICGRPNAQLIGGRPICEQCYENAGSCCLEFGGDDLWQRQEQDAGESRSPRRGKVDRRPETGKEKRS